MPGESDSLYVRARAALLDATDALAEQIDALVLVGLQTTETSDLAQRLRMINVGVDATGFAPISATTVAEMMEAGPASCQVPDRHLPVQ